MNPYRQIFCDNFVLQLMANNSACTVFATSVVDRNRRTRNFLTSGTGTGTVINYDSGTGTSYKIMYLIPSFNIFLFTFYNKFDETYTIFLVKELTM